MKLFNDKAASRCRISDKAFLNMELAVALSIFVIVMIPMGFTVFRDQELMRAYQTRAAIMEIIDGELEVLAAGYWREFPEGSQTYEVKAESEKALHQGQFTLIKNGRHLRLEWIPQKKRRGGILFREVEVTP